MSSENLSGTFEEQGPLYPHGIPIPGAQITFNPEKKPKKRQRNQKKIEITNKHWKGGQFMDTLIEYDSSVNESSLSQIIEPKKLKTGPSNVDKPDKVRCEASETDN